MPRDLRASLKYYGVGRKLSTEDAAIVTENMLASTAFTDHQKQYCLDCSYKPKYVAWGGRKQKVLHMCYGVGKELALTLGKLEQRPAKRKASSKPKSTDERNKVLACCRAVIAPQIAQYRTAFWAAYSGRVEAALKLRMDPPPFPRCKYSGKNLRSCKTHVDHVAPPFVRLVEAWLEAESLQPEQVVCTHKRALRRLSMGDTLDKSWHDYHAKHAVLALVEAKANMSKGCKDVQDSADVL